jgi:C-terminal processing protease CtpA/Prc
MKIVTIILFIRLLAVMSGITVSFFIHSVAAQTLEGQYDSRSDPKVNRTRGLNILEQVNQILSQKYYDESFRGINIKERFKTAEEAIKKQDKNWQIYRSIAQVLIELQDLHTTFLPPDRKYRVEYGFSNIIIGDQSYVVNVKKGSDADKKGLKAGDKIVSIGDIPVSRSSFWVINYLIYGLDPQEQLKLKIATADGKAKDIAVVSRFLSPKERSDERKKRKKDEQSKPFICRTVGTDVMACKLRTFEVEKEAIDRMMKEVGASKKLILDLRGNGGGYVETMKHLTGKFFREDVVIGTEISRGKKKDQQANGSGDKAYIGDLLVLIDSESASASEVFARVIQIEKRGIVVGDTSAGAVMISIGYTIETALYGKTIGIQEPYQESFMSVSVGDLIMKDGNRLEGIGVSPDKPVGPSPQALFSRADPILAYAAELLGSPISAEKAGEMNFLLPKTEDAVDKDAPDDQP